MANRLRDRDQFAFRNLVLSLRPVGYWPLDEQRAPNPGVNVDASRGGTAGSRDLATVGNTPLRPLIRGDRGVSQVFNGGANGSVADASWQDVTNFSMMTHVVTTTSGGASAAMWSKNNSGTDASNPYCLRYNAGGTTLFLFIGNNATAQNMQIGSASQFITGRVHQIIVTADGSNLRAYEAGQQVTSAAQTHTPYNSTGSLFVGKGFAALNNSRMSHVALWNYALSAGDVRNLYRGAFT